MSRGIWSILNPIQRAGYNGPHLTGEGATGTCLHQLCHLKVVGVQRPSCPISFSPCSGMGASLLPSPRAPCPPGPQGGLSPSSSKAQTPNAARQTQCPIPPHSSCETRQCWTAVHDLTEGNWVWPATPGLFPLPRSFQAQWRRHSGPCLTHLQTGRMKKCPAFGHQQRSLGHF